MWADRADRGGALKVVVTITAIAQSCLSFWSHTKPQQVSDYDSVSNPKSETRVQMTYKNLIFNNTDHHERFMLTTLSLIAATTTTTKGTVPIPILYLHTIPSYTHPIPSSSSLSLHCLLASSFP